MSKVKKRNKIKWIGSILFIGVLVFLVLKAGAAEPNENGAAKAIYLKNNFWIDGKDDDWGKEIPRFKGFYQPGVSKEMFEYETEFAVAYDDHNLYFLVVCGDQGSMELSMVHKDGDLDWTQDDIVEIIILNDDNLEPIHCVVNPAGTKFENFIEIGALNYNYEVKTGVEFNRWLAEFRLPFDGFLLPYPKEGAKWRLKVIRRHSLKARQGIWPKGGELYAPDNYGTLTLAPKS